MLSNKSYKFRIYPNKEQSNLIQKTFSCVRFLYNQMLADKIKHYEETKEIFYTTAEYYKTGYARWIRKH